MRVAAPALVLALLAGLPGAALAGGTGPGSESAVPAVKHFRVTFRTVIPLRHPYSLQAAHRAGGGKSRLIVLKGVGHEAWTPAYGDPKLWTWVRNRRLRRW